MPAMLQAPPPASVPASPEALAGVFGAAPMRQLLRRLYLLRYVALCGQALTIVLVEYALEIPLPLRAMGVVLLLELGFNLWVHARLRRDGLAGEREASGHLLFDMLALSALLYLSGGWSNPFVSLLLLPVILAATALPAAHAWAMAALALAAYSVLANQYVPLEVHEVRGFHLHVLGMWFNFAVSVALVAGFVTRLRRAIAERDAKLARAREAALRNERLIAVGLVAAGAAHELATPLNTIALACETLGHAEPEDAALVREQVARCKTILRQLSRTADSGEPGDARIRRADDYLRELVEDWRLMRPQAGAQVVWRGEAPMLRAEATLNQALINLFNNAADASHAAHGSYATHGAPEDVAIAGGVEGGMLRVDILDHGPGLSSEAMEHAGAIRASSSGGLGLGLFLTNASVERLGGRVEMANRPEGGARVTVRLPLTSLDASGAPT
jgi:two-component system sensor histidine kinase RegB